MEDHGAKATSGGQSAERALAKIFKGLAEKEVKDKTSKPTSYADLCRIWMKARYSAPQVWCCATIIWMKARY